MKFFGILITSILISTQSFAQQVVKIIDGNGGTNAAAVTANGLQVDINQSVTISASQGGPGSEAWLVKEVYSNGFFASNNAVISASASTFAAPNNAVGFLLEADGNNTDNVRWAVGSTASPTVGMLAEPGRDSGYMPLAKTISVSSVTGTQSVTVQWVMSQ